MLYGGHEHLVLAGQADGGHLSLVLAQLFLDEGGGLECPLPPEVGGVAYLHLVVVDPQVDEIGRLAAHDYLVVAGVLQLGAEEPAEHGVRIAARLRGERVHRRAVGPRDGGPVKDAGAEDDVIIGGEGVDIRADPVPQYLGGGALTAEMESGLPWIGRYPLYASPGQVDLEIEPRLCIPHTLPLLSSRIPTVRIK